MVRTPMSTRAPTRIPSRPPTKMCIRDRVSDGNFVADIGTPTIDGLGPVGGMMCSPEEYLLSLIHIFSLMRAMGAGTIIGVDIREEARENALKYGADVVYSPDTLPEEYFFSKHNFGGHVLRCV